MTREAPVVSPPLGPGWLLTWAPGWTFLALAATALRAPIWALAPCLLAAGGNAWLCFACLRGPGYATARRAVVWCIAAIWAGLFAFFAGAGWIAWLAVGFGALTGWAGVRHSFKEQPHAPLDLAPKRPTRKVLYFGSSLDLSEGQLLAGAPPR